MDYRTLGTKCAPFKLVPVKMTSGVETDETCRVQLDGFLEVGGRIVDTVDVYGDGRGPRRSSAAGSPGARPRSPSRSCWPPKGRFHFSGDSSPNLAGLSTRHLTRPLDASLRRLGLDD